MNVFAKSDEIQSVILQDVKETKRYGQTVGRTFEQHENSIPSHKHSLRGYKYKCKMIRNTKRLFLVVQILNVFITASEKNPNVSRCVRMVSSGSFN